MTTRKETATVEPMAETTTSGQKAALEAEIAVLANQAEAAKGASLEAAKRRAALEQRRAILATEAARLAELEIDETARLAYEKQQAAAVVYSAQQAEARREVDALIAQRTASLRRVEELAAQLGEEVGKAFSLAGAVDSAVGRAGVPVPGAAPGARALQRHMASRIARLVGGSLGGRMVQEFKDLGRTPLV